MLLGFVLLVVSYVVLWRTSFGLRLRSCGESPAAAESLGVHVMRYKFSRRADLRGARRASPAEFLAMVASSNYRDGQTGGRGYIGLAAMIFGNWRPGGLLAGSGLFGYTETLGLRQGGTSVHALLLAVAVLAVVGCAVVLLVRGRTAGGAVTVGIGLVVALVYLAIDEVPGDFTTMTPYVTTLLVLAFASQRLRMPAADGQVYRKGSGGLAPWPTTRFDWAALQAEAAQAMQHAYAPYSRYRVGAAAVVDDGRRGTAATSRTRRTAWRCAPSAGWSASCTSPAAAG